ncbi:MAG: DUF6249 domain-containing protein [Bacteroidales bacterium]|nr:DUF6249 domain-containing protein [Bacteroidales bacterium]
MLPFDLESILGIIGVFVCIPAMVVLIVWFVNRRKGRGDKIRAELMAKAIENGQMLPENFFDRPKKKHDYLSAGIINIAFGLALSLILWLIVDMQNIWAVGLINVFVGVALLIVHFLEKKKQTEENAK